MTGTRTARLLPSLLAAALLIPEASPAQVLTDSRWAAVAQVSLGRFGHRWGGDDMRVGPGAAPTLGITLLGNPGGRFAFEAMGGFARSDYAVEDESTAGRPDKLRTGRLHLFRTLAGIQYRVLPEVPGYFAAGAGALYHRPVERFTFAEGAMDDEAQWMPSVHLGAGMDFQSGVQVFRVDARLFAARPDQELVTGPLGEQLRARNMAWDFLISIGYVFRF